MLAIALLNVPIASSTIFTEAAGRFGLAALLRFHTCSRSERMEVARVQSGVRDGNSPKVVATSPSPSRSTSRKSAGTTPVVELVPFAGELLLQDTISGSIQTPLAIVMARHRWNRS